VRLSQYTNTHFRDNKSEIFYFVYIIVNDRSDADSHQDNSSNDKFPQKNRQNTRG